MILIISIVHAAVHVVCSTSGLGDDVACTLGRTPSIRVDKSQDNNEIMFLPPATNVEDDGVCISLSSDTVDTLIKMYIQTTGNC